MENSIKRNIWRSDMEDCKNPSGWYLLDDRRKNILEKKGINSELFEKCFARVLTIERHRSHYTRYVVEIRVPGLPICLKCWVPDFDTQSLGQKKAHVVFDLLSTLDNNEILILQNWLEQHS